MARYSTADVRVVQDLVNKAVKAALAGTGFEIENTKGTYGDKLAVSVNFKRAGEAGANDVRDKWNAYCGLYDLKPTDFEATFVNGGKTYKAVGFNLNRPKYPLVGVEVETGKTLFFTELSISKIKRNALVAA